MRLAPIHLEPTEQKFLLSSADQRGMGLSAFVNMLLKKEIELIKSGG